ncbi:hypothetical protein NL54_03235 [Pantoea stewartii]|uniref:hypothetical protein n=1 Tax=Pantoea stewartii TaxID=66269 RepID=UPI000542C5C6|nr:hypothetical protein [Pantoea stewartii]KHE02655.1 hypothetical protein NL54_03235 [Pantoea stewartii]KHN64528.1 hypothetical protein OI73_05815 [Pantoea stewartii]
MHYTRMINPLTLLNCDSPASAKIMVDYVKTQLNVRLDYRLMVDADPQVPADGLPDYLTFLRHVARSVGFATEHGYIRHAFTEEAVAELTLLGTSVNSLHWNAAFHEGATRSREDKELDNATEQLRAMFYQSADVSDIV